MAKLSVVEVIRLSKHSTLSWLRLPNITRMQ
nr:MAG TPA: hypothetical protein [Caudoviricetes sp.]